MTTPNKLPATTGIKPAWKRSEPPEGTFEYAFKKRVRPKVKNKVYQGRLDNAVSRFYLWRGGPTPLSEMSDRLIDQFKAALVDAGAAGATAHNYPTVLRRILRRIDAKLCRPKLHGWKRRDYAPGEPGTLSHFLELTYIPLRLLDASEGTIHNHRMTLDALARHMGREPVIGDLTDETLAGFMREAVKRGAAPATTNNRRCYFSAWWRLAKRRGLVSTLPDIPKLREFYREPAAWDIEQMSAIVCSILRERGTVAGVPAADWWLAFLELNYATALRWGTMTRLEHSHLNLTTCVLDVPGSIMKNRRGKKFILPPDAIDAVRRIWCPSSGKLFRHHWGSKRGPYVAWRRIVERAGINWDRHQGFHMIRRTSATWVAVKGGLVAAMSLLGHGEEYVTRRYVDPTKIPGHNVAAFLPPIPKPRAAIAAKAVCA